MHRAYRHRVPALSLVGLSIALVLPALATFRIGFTDAAAAIALAVTPWLTILWIIGAEREPLSSIGLTVPRPRNIAMGVAGAAVNMSISVGATFLLAQIGIKDSQSVDMERLLKGSGLILILFVTNGALLSEVSFRAYAIERLESLTRGRERLTAVLQIAITTAIFVVGRGWAHGVVWLLDDIVFTAFYLKTRNTCVCVVATPYRICWHPRWSYSDSHSSRRRRSGPAPWTSNQ